MFQTNVTNVDRLVQSAQDKLLFTDKMFYKEKSRN